MAKNTDRNNRPRVVEPDYSVVPEVLRTYRHWVLWRYDWNVKRGEWAKVPYQPNGQHASSTDPQTWSSYSTCVLTFEQSRATYDGLGFVFSADTPFVGVDIDDCVQDQEGDQILTPFAARIVERLQTYTELSPSLKGIHLIGEAGKLDAVKTAWNGNKIEIYRQGRYFTFSGRSWQESPLDVVDVSEPLGKIIAKIKKPEPNGSVAPLTVDQRLELALKNPKTASLFHGSTIEYGGDDSRADMGLCSMLAYFSGGSLDTLDAMFRRSKLFRSKWDERHGADTYGNLTLKKVLSNQTSFLGVRGATQEAASDFDSRKARRFSITDLRDKALEFRKSGGSKGVHPGWDALEPCYRPGLAQLSIVTGEPGSGKSTWVDCLVYNIAKRHKWGIVFASFETMPLERHVLNLCQIHLQKPTFSWIPGCASDDEINKAIDEMADWFHFLFPNDNELDIDSILAYVDDEIRENGITGFVLDPFTEMEQNRIGNLTQTEQIERILRKLQHFTRHREIHTWLIAHPTKAGDTYKDGRPTMRSISGSANFYNKADFGIVVERSDEDEVKVHIDKVRFDSNGGRGKVAFQFNKERRAYDEENMGWD